MNIKYNGQNYFIGVRCFRYNNYDVLATAIMNIVIHFENIFGKFRKYEKGLY